MNSKPFWWIGAGLVLLLLLWKPGCTETQQERLAALERQVQIKQTSLAAVEPQLAEADHQDAA